jgi:NMD protein affecting ribosome stability and mRNA decay
MYTKQAEESVCPRCQPEEDQDFESIRDALQGNPSMTAEQLAESTGVDLDCVLRCIESGRIQSVSSSNSIRCGKCGSPAISLSKKLCEKCLNELSQQVAKVQSSIRLPKKQEVQVGKALNVEDGPGVRVSRGKQFRNG